MSFHILLAILACPILALGSPANEVDFDGESNINTQGRAKQQDPETPLGKS